MHEGTHAVLILDGQEYELSHFKVTEDAENYFCAEVELVICDDYYPEIIEGESYVARIEANGDAVWYLPWVRFKKSKLPKMEATVNGAIFCPFGLTQEDEDRYDAINLIIASDICYQMTAEVWKNLLLVFGDWLKSKSVPQHTEYNQLSDEIEIPDDDYEDDYDDDDDDDDDDDYDYEDDDYDDYDDEDDEDDEDDDDDDDDDDYEDDEDDDDDE